MPLSPISNALATPDGQALSVRLWAAEAPKALVLQLLGLGIPQRVGFRLAEHLCTRGYTVLTADLRGIGESAPAHWKGFRATANDWIFTDIPALIDHLQAQHPHLPLWLLGHSFAGQVAGLLPNHPVLKGLVLLGSGTGTHTNYAGGRRRKYELMWRGFVPFFARTSPFLPHWVMGGVRVPMGVIRQWTRWCLAEDYLWSDLGHGLPRTADHYAELTFPVLAFHSLDDQVINTRGREHLLRHYPAARIQRFVFEPRQLGLEAFGHMGFFRSATGQAFWPLLVQQLDAAVMGRDAPAWPPTLPAAALPPSSA